MSKSGPRDRPPRRDTAEYGVRPSSPTDPDTDPLLQASADAAEAWLHSQDTDILPSNRQASELLARAIAHSTPSSVRRSPDRDEPPPGVTAVRPIETARLAAMTEPPTAAAPTPPPIPPSAKTPAIAPSGRPATAPARPGLPRPRRFTNPMQVAPMPVQPRVKPPAGSPPPAATPPAGAPPPAATPPVAASPQPPPTSVADTRVAPATAAPPVAAASPPTPAAAPPIATAPRRPATPVPAAPAAPAAPPSRLLSAGSFAGNTPMPNMTSVKTGRHKRVGLVDGRYELIAQLSEGGMGRVYRAVHRELGREFALKSVLEGMKDDLPTRELFLREARLASALQHPNIVSVTDFGVDETVGFYLVMELLVGETLRERMANGPTGTALALEVVDQVAGALRFVHGRGIVHCDLKPENIFLTQIEGGEHRTFVKLLDFGLSTNRESLPETEVCGTPPYVAPERILEQPAAPACDIYSLGILLYELLTGALPFDGQNIMQIMDAQLRGPTPAAPSKRSRERLPPGTDELVMRAMARDASKRHASVAELQEELAPLLAAVGVQRRDAGPTVAVADSAPSSESRAIGAGALRGLLEDCPLPLAVFDPGGTLRATSKAFLGLAHAAGGRPTTFRELALVAAQPPLQQAFAEAVRTGRVVRRIALVDLGGIPHTLIVVIAPARPRGAVDAVYVNLVGTGFDG